MTNNQREFQREVNRLMREITQLQQQHHFKHIAPLPEQPKRITRKHIEELKGLKGRHFVGEAPKSTKRRTKDNEPTARKQTKKYDEPSYSIRQKKEDVYDNPKTKGRRKVRSDIGTKRKTPSPLKGIKRGSLSPEEKERRNAKRLETLSKSNKPRKTRKDKGTHLTAEERARRNAKRLETIAKKSRPTSDEYAPTDTAPKEWFNAVDHILSMIESAMDTCEENIRFTSRNPHTKYDGYERMGYLFILRDIVLTNRDREDYYKTLQDREAQISKLLDAISQYPNDRLAEVVEPNSAYEELAELLTPDGYELDLERIKEISQKGEYYVDNVVNYN